MKHLFNNLSAQEKMAILEMHGIKNQEQLDEQLGSKAVAAARGLGARVSTIGQNLKTAVSPDQGNRVVNSPKLNAAIARVKSRTASLQKLVNELYADLKNVTTITATEKNGQFKDEATQIENLVIGYMQTLSQVTDFNNKLSGSQLQTQFGQNTGTQTGGQSTTKTTTNETAPGSPIYYPWLENGTPSTDKLVQSMQSDPNFNNWLGELKKLSAEQLKKVESDWKSALNTLSKDKEKYDANLQPFYVLSDQIKVANKMISNNQQQNTTT